MDAFYVVWCPGGGNPNYRHDSHELATREAERLARQNSGKEFFVLLATDRIAKNDIVHERLTAPDDDHVPF